MDELNKLDKWNWEWFMGVVTKTWCKRSFIFYPKCNVLVNNIYGSFNAIILVARYKLYLENVGVDYKLLND